MDKTLDQFKFKRTAHVIRIIMQVMFWVTVVVSVLCAIAFVVINFLPEKLLTINGAKGNFTLSVGDMVSYKINTINGDIVIKNIVRSILVMATLGIAGFSILINEVLKILKMVEIHKPFHEANSKSLRNIGILFIIGSVFYRAAAFFVIITTVETLKIPNIIVNYNIDGFMMLFGFIMFIISGVFKYGAFLQEEYDTTL